jgi:membrane protease YdiL (CAAX protease family)
VTAEQRGASRPIVVFVAITYALSIALSFVIGLTGGYQSRLIGLAFLSMLIPATAVVIVDLAMDERIASGWNRLPLAYVPVALLLIPLVMHAAMLPMTVVVDGRLPWENWLTPQADGWFHTPASRGWGVLTLNALVARIAINALVGLVIVSVLASFEEVGWRAWLLPRLMVRFGARRAVVLTAVIWAFWHTPYQLSGLQHIAGVSPGRLALTMPIAIFGPGLVIGWLWLRTRSIWIVSLAHGALNNWGQYAFKYMQDTDADETIVLIAGGAALAVVGGLLLTFAGTTNATKTALDSVGARD